MKCVGADVLICPVERSFDWSCIRVTIAELRSDRADEDICPYVVRGLAGGGVLGRLRFFGRGFAQGFFQVGMQFVEFGHGQL